MIETKVNKTLGFVTDRTSASKRPAAFSGGDKFTVTFEDSDRQFDRNTFASKWYGRAKSWAKHHLKGKSVEQVNAFARLKFQEAGKLFASKMYS